MSRHHPALPPVLLFLVLAIPLAAHWSAPGDEGVTFNQAIGPVMLEANGGETTAFGSIAAILGADHAYGVKEVLEAMRDRGMHPPAYYVLTHLWTRVVGTSPGWLRLPGILLGILSVVGIWALTRELLPEGSAATWAAFLMAASVNLAYFSVYLRPYSLELPLLIGSVWLMLRLRAEGSPNREAARWAGFVTLSLLGLYTLYHYVFALAWQFLVMLLWALAAPRVSRRVDVAKIVAAGLLIVLGFAPWLTTLSGHLELTASQRFYFQGVPPPETWLFNSVMLIRQLVLRKEFLGIGVSYPVAELALITLLIVCWPLLASGPSEGKRERQLFWLSLPFLPAAVLFADSLRDTHTAFLLKTMLALLPLAIVALAVGAKSPSLRPFGTGLLVLWLAVFLVGSASRVARAVGKPAWQEQVAENLRSWDREDHVVVFSSRDRRFLHPMLVRLRDIGTRHIELTVAGRPKLDEVMPGLLEDPQIRTISLVSFGDDEGWSVERRKRAVAVARTHSWRSIPNGIPNLITLQRT